MKLPTFNRIVWLITLLAVGAFCPNLRADWGSLQGNNRSSTPTQSVAPRPQPQVNHQAPAPSVAPRPQPPANHAPQPRIRPEPRQEVKPVQAPKHAAEPVRPQHVAEPVQPPRAAEPVRPSPVAVKRVRNQPQVPARTQATEVGRRRMDIDEDRRQSFFWSDYHAGMRIGRLPDGYRRFDLRGHPFFYYEGVYYDGGPSGYVIIAPPVDADISDLPPGTETVVVGDTIYYYAGGAFYVQQPDGSYLVVAPPMGVTVTMFPPDAVSVVINGTVYYQADGTYYLPVMQNGVTAYLTVPQP
jgi:hypothetical protein